MENEKITNCNQCPNHCPADALQCGRGRHYFEQLENPEARNENAGGYHRHGEGHHGKEEGHGHGEGRYEREENHGHGEGRYVRGEGHGHGEGNHESGEGRQHGRGHGKPDDLYGLMRACVHYLHHSSGKASGEGGTDGLPYWMMQNRNL